MTLVAINEDNSIMAESPAFFKNRYTALFHKYWRRTDTLDEIAQHVSVNDFAFSAITINRMMGIYQAIVYVIEMLNVDVIVSSHS